MRAALSDCHMGNRGDADDCNYEGLLQLLIAIVSFHPDKIVLLGDIFERWQFSLKSIIEANKPFFAELDKILSGMEIEYVEGNHDSDIDENATALQQVLPSTKVTPHREYYDSGDWRFLHGYQFDRQNRKGWFRPVAHGLTYFAGLLEKVFPGINENKLNPASWVSPAKKLDRSIAGEIQDEVFKYSKETGKKICYGHTHDSDLSRDGRIANTGCVTGGSADAVLIYDDGIVNLVHAGKVANG